VEASLGRDSRGGRVGRGLHNRGWGGNRVGCKGKGSSCGEPHIIQVFETFGIKRAQ